MSKRKGLHVAACALVAACLALCATCAAVEDVNMGTSLHVEGGHLTVRWSTRGFDYYNVRWSINGGVVQQEQRDGDKDFTVLPGAFQPGALYRAAVEGCDKNFAAPSHCTHFDEASCGSAREPCDGIAPRPIASGGGLCLEVHAPDQRVNGGRVQLWHCNGSDQQLWTIRDGRIVSLAGKCLDVHFPELHTDGGRVQVWDCNGSVQQRWLHSGQTLRSGGGKCLDAHLPDLHNDGARVQVWDCNGALQQMWRQSSSY